MKSLLPSALLLSASLFSMTAHGQCRTLPNSGTFTVNGNAIHIADGEFRLTEDANSQSGSLWYGNYLDLESDFDLEFEVNLGSNDGGADGLAFVLQQSPEGTASLSKGGGLGYKGITPSVAVEYDTWSNNEYNDPLMDHIGLQKNGDVVHFESNELERPSMQMNIEDGKWHNTRIKWSAGSKRLQVYWDGSSIPVLEKTLNMQDEIFGTNPYVYWGWTGSTGDARNLQRVKVKQVQFVQKLTVTASVVGAGCAGSTGSVDITVLGGIQPIKYVWSNGAVTEDINRLPAGSYSVKVTDACGNQGEGSFTVGSDGPGAIIKCPADIIVDNTPGICGNTNVEFPQPVLESACKGSRWEQIAGYPSGSFFDMGKNTVTFQVVAPDGTPGSQCSFTVEVR